MKPRTKRTTVPVRTGTRNLFTFCTPWGRPATVESPSPSRGPNGRPLHLRRFCGAAILAPFTGRGNAARTTGIPTGRLGPQTRHPLPQARQSRGKNIPRKPSVYRWRNVISGGLISPYNDREKSIPRFLIERADLRFILTSFQKCIF